MHPALVWCLCGLAVKFGLNLPREVVVALVLVAALPSASNVSLLTDRYGAHGGRVARIILVSTAWAFVTFSLAVDGLM